MTMLGYLEQAKGVMTQHNEESTALKKDPILILSYFSAATSTVFERL